MSKRRLDDIDRAKGLAIFLVVLGHIVARTPPVGNEWYVVLKETIYQFHMPLFMFLCGLVMGYGLVLPKSWTEYRQWVARKFVRLFPAYMLFGVLILAGKIHAARFLAVDNEPPSFFAGLADLLLHPTASSAASLWFIYVLFVFYVLVPPLLKLVGNRPWALVLLGLAVHFLPRSIWLEQGRVAEFSVYVFLGVAAAYRYDDYVAWVDRRRGVSVPLFVAGLVLFAAAFVMTGEPNDVPWMRVAKLMLGLAAIPAVHACVRSTRWGQGRWLAVMGQYTFAIYLMNTIAIGMVKGLMLRVIPWDGLYFLIYAPVLLASGVLLCIAFKRWVLARMPLFDRITS